ncbi:MAG TPA: hypothetical protein VKD71_08580 [Gemmataceae bacterium]|nr:hypothetical protein [Gemmataceae bacterium]
MSALASWTADFDLGEYVGIGLSTNQIGYLAGALFLGLFGLSALRRAKGAVGVWPVVWVAVAIALFAGTVLIAARGFPDDIPDWLKPWAETDRLIRAAAVAVLLGCATVLVSAYWVRGPMARLGYRLAGTVMAAMAVWLASGWFADQVPYEVREWTGQAEIMRAVVLLGLVFLAAALWVRDCGGTPHARWLNRALVPPAIAMIVILGTRWFGTRARPDLPTSEVQFVAVVLATIGTGTCFLIGVGAYLIRERTIPPKPVKAIPLAATVNSPRPATPDRALPVALLLDEHGRPVLPASGEKDQRAS